MAKKKFSTLQRVRIMLASLCFPLITLLFLDFTGTLHRYFGFLAKVQFLPAVLALNFAVVAALVVLTLVMGRIYCSVICPLGVMQDVIAIQHVKRKKNRYTYSKPLTWLRIASLVVFVGVLLAGFGSIAGLIAPYTAYGRIASSLLQPIYIAANNGLAAIAEHYDSYLFYETELWLKGPVTLVVAICTLIVVGAMAWRGGRTWCNTVCPVGTVLGFLSKFAWFKIHFDEDKCIKCGLCTKNCKASAIDHTHYYVDHSRCVDCGTCISKCPKDALSLCHKANTKADASAQKQETATADESRRAFLIGTAIATTGAALAQEKKKVDGGLAVIEDKVQPERATPLTPPGSLSARNMQQHCTACQLCVSACPNNVLRPSTELSRLMQPTMSYERGYCRPECTRCSRVCPAGAIKPITPADKSATHIGHAVWVKKNCIPVTDGHECGNCERHCPVGAIIMVPLDENDEMSPMVPAVNESACIGCGACENLCPARPFSAIYVEGHEQHRID